MGLPFLACRRRCQLRCVCEQLVAVRLIGRGTIGRQKLDEVRPKAQLAADGGCSGGGVGRRGRVLGRCRALTVLLKPTRADSSMGRVSGEVANSDDSGGGLGLVCQGKVPPKRTRGGGFEGQLQTSGCENRGGRIRAPGCCCCCCRRLGSDGRRAPMQINGLLVVLSFVPARALLCLLFACRLQFRRGCSQTCRSAAT